MSDRLDINAIFDRIAKRDFTDEDIQTLRQSIVGTVAIGGNADGTTIVTGDDNILGDNNTVQVGNELIIGVIFAGISDLCYVLISWLGIDLMMGQIVGYRTILLLQILVYCITHSTNSRLCCRWWQSLSTTPISANCSVAKWLTLEFCPLPELLRRASPAPACRWELSLLTPRIARPFRPVE